MRLEVFKILATKENRPLPDAIPEFSTLNTLVDWLASTRNDLEAPAIQLEPVIGDVLTALEKSDALFSRMSGSGATCFGLYPSDEAAKDAQAKLAAEQPDWWITATQLGDQSHLAQPVVEPT